MPFCNRRSQRAVRHDRLPPRTFADDMQSGLFAWCEVDLTLLRIWRSVKLRDDGDRGGRGGHPGGGGRDRGRGGPGGGRH